MNHAYSTKIRDTDEQILNEAHTKPKMKKYIRQYTGRRPQRDLQQLERDINNDLLSFIKWRKCNDYYTKKTTGTKTITQNDHKETIIKIRQT